jgi:hypothetical protein
MQQAALAQLSHSAIDESILNLDAESLQTLIGTPNSQANQLLEVYQAIRPLLEVVALLPIIPVNWRAAVRLFVVTLDQFDASFKAGKDLNSFDTEEVPS